MKKILFWLTLLASIPSFADEGALKIYYSLDVEEVPMNAPRTQMIYKKSTGGLTCIKVNNIIGRDATGRDKVNCSLKF